MDHELIGTADICDEEPAGLRIVKSNLQCYGGRQRCQGEIITIRLDTGSHGLKALLAEPGNGRVVVVDVGGRYFSVVGDRVGTLAATNGWNGLIINGYIRDSLPLKDIDICVWALGTCPRKGIADSGSETGVPLNFGGIEFCRGDYLYSDPDGIIVVDNPLPNLNF